MTPTIMTLPPHVLRQATARAQQARCDTCSGTGKVVCDGGSYRDPADAVACSDCNGCGYDMDTMVYLAQEDVDMVLNHYRADCDLHRVADHMVLTGWMHPRHAALSVQAQCEAFYRNLYDEQEMDRTLSDLVDRLVRRGGWRLPL